MYSFVNLTIVDYKLQTLYCKLRLTATIRHSMFLFEWCFECFNSWSCTLEEHSLHNVKITLEGASVL